MSLLKKLNLIDGLICGITVSLIILKASWPLAIVFLGLGTLKGIREYQESKKSKEIDGNLKDRLTAVENKMAMMGLRK